MSLVGDALRRARAEGARRRGVAIPPGLGPPIRRSLLGGPAMVVLSLVLAAAGAALVTWWLVGRGAGGPSATGEVGRDTASVGQAARDVAPVGAESETVVPSPTAPPQVADRATTTGASPTTAGESVAPPSGTTAPIAKPPHRSSDDALAPAPTTPASEAHSSATAERSFVIDAELGYAKLHLDYLVYKPSAPFARINGRDVVVGSIVAGFQVEEIGPDFVRLSDSRGPLTLRVR